MLLKPYFVCAMQVFSYLHVILRACARHTRAQQHRSSRTAALASRAQSALERAFLKDVTQFA
jgi:hypothetical protein